MIKKLLIKILIYFKYRNININAGTPVEYKSLRSTFTSSEGIKLGSHVYIGPGANFDGRGGLIISDNVIIAPNVTIMTRNHVFDGSDLKALPFDNRVVLKSVFIDKNVWIGSHVLILPGVSIGEGSVIAAGSVVTKDVAKLTLVGGNPAKEIKKRRPDVYMELMKKNVFVYEKFGRDKEFVTNHD